MKNATDQLNDLLENKMKKDGLNDLKTINFVDKVDNVINKHMGDKCKKVLLDKLKDINDKKQLKDALDKWKDFNKEMKNRDKILNKLKRHK